MAKIEDLIRQVSDERLREELASEVRELKKHKRFGLVFEEHLPEMLRIPKATIRIGNVVAPRDASASEVWRVLEITGKKAKCRQPLNPTRYDQEMLKDFPLDELVLVVRFGAGSCDITYNDGEIAGIKKVFPWPGSPIPATVACNIHSQRV